MALSRPARGLLVGALTIVLALAMLAPLRSDIDTATAALVLVFPGVAAAIAGGRLAALVSAVASAAVFNVVFLRPYGTLQIGLAEEVVSLVVLVVVALTVATLVAREAERRAAAERRAFEVADARAATDRAVAEAMALGLAGEHRAALLRSVSHDLRTPLSTIRAVASDLRDGGGEYDESTREELLDLVVDEAERLDRFVANLLSLSRVDAGALEADRQAIALDELLDQCVRRHARLVRDRKVSVDVPLTLPLVDADWTLVDQAVTNLVANAVRHAPAGSRIWVSAREVEPGWVEVRVTDQGPGIPAAERAAAFQPFRRGPGSSSSGVGLAIVRAVVDAHGGEVGIEEGPAGGTSVRFTLPVHRD
jgi:two-component system, OmpR family, sensor histidine kinase KdpD